MSALRLAEPRSSRRTNLGVLALVVAVLLGTVLLALAQSTRVHGALDPDAVDPTGSHALAVLLEHQGVQVVRVATADAARTALGTAGADSTLLVVPTAAVSVDMADAVDTASPAYVVLVQPDQNTLDGFAPSVAESGGEASDVEIAPGCAWDVARRAGALPKSGILYASSDPAASSCWGGTVLDLPAGSQEAPVTVLGDAAVLTNEKLASSGYAALTLGALGRAHTLVWWLPSIADPLQLHGRGDVGVLDLVPSCVGWALLQLALAMLVVVWWRGRRLGRVVLEPLPVVVRATETVEGRARLYRRGRARGHAADALRAATSARLRTLLSLPRTADLPALLTAVAARTGRPAPAVAALLLPGQSPPDDASLTRLAHALDTLENEVRRS
jgi:hypothetical protein